MKKKVFIRICAAMAAFFLITGCVPQPVDVSGEISVANKSLMDSFIKGDIESLTMAYTENAKLFPTNSPVIEGKENIRAYWEGATSMGITKVDLETLSAEAFGNTAIEEGKYALFVEGDFIVDEGKYIVIWEKVDGKWLLAKDIMNTSLPAPDNSMNFNSGNIFGLHHLKITLKENVSPAEFEKFYTEEYIPEFEKLFPGVKIYLLKGERGANKDKYGGFICFKSLEERNYWIPEPGKMSEKGIETLKIFQPWQDKADKMFTEELISYTDWLVF
ncbi:MAG: DUF4440 domain-containing protein [Bacteroidia bacterium]|nr:MAG: DUF4440 domain-containing protein [Bacteroidia bacterium]